MTSRGLLLLIFSLLVSCAAPKPIKDYTLAQVALESARDAEAARYAPGHWHHAETAFQKARRFYKEGEFEESRRQLIRSRIYAEKAENTARLIRFQNGEAF